MSTKSISQCKRLAALPSIDRLVIGSTDDDLLWKCYISSVAPHHPRLIHRSDPRNKCHSTVALHWQTGFDICCGLRIEGGWKRLGSCNRTATIRAATSCGSCPGIHYLFEQWGKHISVCRLGSRLRECMDILCVVVEGGKAMPSHHMRSRGQSRRDVPSALFRGSSTYHSVLRRIHVYTYILQKQLCGPDVIRSRKQLSFSSRT